VNAFYRDPADGRVRSITFGQNTSESDLLAINHIPNNGVMAPRSVLEKIGLYDPHIAVARICDYDLWLRARRRVPISFVSMCIGEEHGPAFSNSLGSTYVLDHWVADDRMRQVRNELLGHERFLDVDVFDIERFGSERTREIARGLADGHRRTHPWMTAPEAVTASRRVPRIMVVTSPIDATVQLVFEALRDVPDIHVRMVDPTRRYLGELAAADVLILARRVRDDWVQAANLLGIPVFYYLDDNLPLMAAAGELADDDAREFGIETLRAAVSSLHGVLTSTEALAQSFRDQGLHRSVWALPLTIPWAASHLDPPAPHADGDPATFALFVGAHRLASFRRTIWHAFVEAARRTGRPIRILVPEGATSTVRRLRDERVTVEPVASHGDYFSAVRELRTANADALVVPPAESVNSPYKTLHPFLSATILDAVLLAPASAPYLELADEDRVELVQQPTSIPSWTDAIVGALGVIPRTKRGARSVDRFAPEHGAERLLAAIGDRVPEAEPDIARRVLQISDWLAHQLLVTRSLMHGVNALPARGVDTGLTNELHDVVRRSRRLHAFRSSSTPLSSFGDPSPVAATAGLRRGEWAELSIPLATVPYLSYRMTLREGRYRRLRAVFWGDGEPGDMVGIEIVDPAGQICLHTVAALPRNRAAFEVAFDARNFTVTRSGPHELRAFVRSAGAAHLVEIVDRGSLGMRRPRVRPAVRFDRYRDDGTGRGDVTWLR
jgi:hypothetical protein